MNRNEVRVSTFGFRVRVRVAGLPAVRDNTRLVGGRVQNVAAAVLRASDSGGRRARKRRRHLGNLLKD
jgi:hypothetical protein